jgi:hypothetical protein
MTNAINLTAYDNKAAYQMVSNNNEVKDALYDMTDADFVTFLDTVCVLTEEQKEYIFNKLDITVATPVAVTSEPTTPTTPITTPITTSTSTTTSTPTMNKELYFRAYQDTNTIVTFERQCKTEEYHIFDVYVKGLLDGTASYCVWNNELIEYDVNEGTQQMLPNSITRFLIEDELNLEQFREYIAIHARTIGEHSYLHHNWIDIIQIAYMIDDIYAIRVFDVQTGEQVSIDKLS